MKLQLFKPKNKALKERVLKNKEALLDVMSENIKGARQCPYLMGNKCLGQMCEMFMNFKSVKDDGTEFEYWRCAFVQTPLLIIELNNNVRELIKSIYGKKVGV